MTLIVLIQDCIKTYHCGQPIDRQYRPGRHSNWIHSVAPEDLHRASNLKSTYRPYDRVSQPSSGNHNNRQQRPNVSFRPGTRNIQRISSQSASSNNWSRLNRQINSSKEFVRSENAKKSSAVVIDDNSVDDIAPSGWKTPSVQKFAPKKPIPWIEKSSSSSGWGGKSKSNWNVTSNSSFAKKIVYREPQKKPDTSVTDGAVVMMEGIAKLQRPVSPSSMKKIVRTEIGIYNDLKVGHFVSDYFIRYQMELWGCTNFFSKNIVNFEFSYKDKHPLEQKKPQVIADINKDLSENIAVMKASDGMLEKRYMLRPRWKGGSSKKEKDYLSLCFFLKDDFVGMDPCILDQTYTDSIESNERKQLNFFLHKLSECVSFDGGCQHLIYKYNQQVDNLLPCFCPLGYLLRNWRKDMELEPDKDTFWSESKFPYCKVCDDTFDTPYCFAEPSALLHHLYSNADSCPIHAITLVYLLRLYDHVPQINTMAKDVKFKSSEQHLFTKEQLQADPHV